MAISKYACYIYDSGKHLLKQGSLSYSSTTGKYTFSETLANINQGEIAETKIVVAVPDGSYDGYFPYMTVKAPQGYTTQPLGMVKADITIIEGVVETLYQAATIDLSLVALTRYAGIHTFVIGWLTNGSYVTLDGAKYTVDDGVNNYEDIEADNYEDIYASLELTFAAYADRVIAIENFITGGLGYVSGQTNGIRTLKLYHVDGDVVITTDGTKVIVNIGGVDYYYAIKNADNTFSELNTFVKQITAQAGIEMSASKITGLAAGTNENDAIRKKQLDDGLLLKEDLTNKVTSIGATATDDEYVSAKALYEKFLTKVATSFTIAGLDLTGEAITLLALKTAIGEATTSANGLLSATDKTLIDVLRASYSDDDGNDLVNTIKEVLAAFDEFPETTDLMAYFATKVDKVEGKELSENDLTDALKVSYDGAVTHANLTDGTNPHATTYANVASKPTTFDGFGLANGSVETIEATTSVTTPKVILANGTYIEYNSTDDSIDFVFPE